MGRGRACDASGRRRGSHARTRPEVGRGVSPLGPLSIRQTSSHPTRRVPASLVSVLVTTAGLMFVRLTLTGGLGAILGEGVMSAENWAALAPELLWPLWGAALGTATLACYYRRRGQESR